MFMDSLTSINKRFLSEIMFGFCNSFRVLFWALISDAFSFIIKHITRLRVFDDHHERKSESIVVCAQSDDENFARKYEPDGYIEKEVSEFSFGFRFCKDFNQSFVETESSVSKCQSVSSKHVSGFIQEPETMSFSVEESFGDFVEKGFVSYSGIVGNEDLKEQDFEGLRNGDSDQFFIDLKVSDFGEGQKRNLETEFVDQDQTDELSITSSSEEEGLNSEIRELPRHIDESEEGYISEELEDLKENEGLKSEIHKLPQHIDEGEKGYFSKKLEDLKENEGLNSDICDLLQHIDEGEKGYFSKKLEGLKENEGLNSDICELPQHIDESEEGYISDKSENLEDIISTSSDEDLIFNKYISVPEDTDEEFIELEPHFRNIADDLVKASPLKDFDEQQNDHDLVTRSLDGSENYEENCQEKRKSWEWESDDEEDEDEDILMEHRNLIEQLKMESKQSRNGGLPTILEESETPKISEDLKPLQIDEKLEHSDHIQEIQKFYKSYSDKMRKLDVLNYQTMHAISFIQLKEPVKQFSSQKSAVSALKSKFLPNFSPGKLRKIYADQTFKKSVSELQKDLEHVYVGQICVSWEILHWQYTKTKELQEHNNQDCRTYNQVAGEFQQFQVLMHRFLEDELFQGPRVQNYVNKRHVVLSLLQVPIVKDDCLKDKKRVGEHENSAISIAMLTEIIEESMRVFWEFLRADKHEATLSLKRVQGTKLNRQDAADLELIMNIKSNLEKKEKRLKEILRKSNCIVNKFQKHQSGGRVKHDLLCCQVDLRLVSRVLHMSRWSREQLFWCQSKLNKINFVNRKLHVEPSFLLFPCEYYTTFPHL